MRLNNEFHGQGGPLAVSDQVSPLPLTDMYVRAAQQAGHPLTDDFNGAQCKAVCVEAGMIALRREATIVTHEDFMDGILEVQAKKKQNLNYYA